VRRHKAVSGCAGLKPTPKVVGYVPFSGLNQEVLEADDQLLSDASVTVSRLQEKKDTTDGRRKFLQSYCRRQGIILALMPSEMTRAKLNKTKVISNVIEWTIEWILTKEAVTQNFKEIGRFYTQASERSTVDESLPTGLHGKPHSCHLRLEIEHSTNRSTDNISQERRLWPIYTPLVSTWQQLLQHRTILEYPTVIVTLIE